MPFGYPKANVHSLDTARYCNIDAYLTNKEKKRSSLTKLISIYVKDPPVEEVREAYKVLF